LLDHFIFDSLENDPIIDSIHRGGGGENSGPNLVESESCYFE